MKRLGHLAIYLLSFVLGRGALIAAPLLLANLLGKVEYGRVEWAQATGSLLSSWLTLGTASALPLVMVVGDSEATLPGIFLHHLIVGSCALGVSALLWIFGASPELRMAALFTATLVFQTLWSTKLKTEGRAEASIFLQAGLFTLLAGSAVFSIILLQFQHRPALWGTAIAYTLAMFLLATVRLRRSMRRGELLHYRSSLKVGVPLMLGGVFTVMATTSDRFCIGLVGTPTMTAEYAVLARGAAAPIVVHQLMTIIRFRQLFEMDRKKLEEMIAQIVLLVALAAVCFLICYPWIGPLLGHAFTSAFDRYRGPAVWILASEILWCAIALNDLVFTRLSLVRRVLPWTGVCLMFAYAGGWLALRHWGINLSHFAYLYVGLMATYYLCQVSLMIRWKLFQPRAVATVLGSLAAFILFAQLRY